MELLVIVLLLFVVAALSVLLWRRPRSRETRSELATVPAGQLATVPAAQPEHRVEAPQTPEDEPRVFRLADPSGRELFAEIIQPSESLLFAPGDTPHTNQGSSVALGKILSTLPYIGAAVKGGQWVRILNPQALEKGEQMRSGAGGLLGGVRGPDKLIAGQLRFTKPQDLAQLAAPLAVFKVAAAVTGQYYLNRINGQLITLEGQVRQIRQELRNETYGEITAAAEACMELEEGLALSYDLTADERVRLVQAERDIDKAYRHKLKDCDDFVQDVEKLFKAKSLDRAEAERLLSEAAGIRTYDAQLLTYAAAVRHKLNVLRAQVELGADDGRDHLTSNKLDRELREMRRDLFAVGDAIGKLAITREQAEKFWTFGFRGPPRRFNDFAEQGNTLYQQLAVAPLTLLPDVAPAPMVLEAFLGEDGLVQILGATPEREPVPVNATAPVGDVARKQARLAVLQSRRRYQIEQHDTNRLYDLETHIDVVEAELKELERADDIADELVQNIAELRKDLGSS